MTMRKAMRRAMLAAVLWLAATTAVFGSTRIIPVAGHLPGANGTAWTTDVSLTNNSLTAVIVDLVFHPEDGIARTRSITLDANQSMLLEDAVEPAQFPGANPPSWLGQLEVRSTGDVSASAHIFTAGASGGTFGSTYEGIDATTLSLTGSLTGLISSIRFRSNVAFANPSGQTASLDYVLRRVDGSTAAIRGIQVPPHSTRQLSLGGDVDTTPGDDRLSLSWSSNVPA
jgi:P pilus assembly chaperone PapD